MCMKWKKEKRIRILTLRRRILLCFSDVTTGHNVSLSLGQMSFQILVLGHTSISRSNMSVSHIVSTSSPSYVIKKCLFCFQPFFSPCKVHSLKLWGCFHTCVYFFFGTRGHFPRASGPFGDVRSPFSSLGAVQSTDPWSSWEQWSVEQVMLLPGSGWLGIFCYSQLRRQKCLVNIKHHRTGAL